MKNRTGTVVLLATVGTLCLGVTGCGKMTTEKLLTKMNQAVDGRQMTYAEFTEEMEASYQMDVMGANMSMDMSMTMDMKEYVNADPLSGYIEGTVNVNMMEQDVESDMKIYMGEEDGSVSAYVYTGMNDDWSRMDVDFDLEEYKKLLNQNTVANLFAGVGSADESIAMDEETSDLDGTEVYVLRGSFMGEDVEELLSGAGVSMFMGDGMNMDLSLEDLSVPMVCYVDAATYLPVQIEMDIEGMDSLVDQMLESELGQLEGETEDLGMEISVGTCHVVMKNFSYEPQDIPAVPEEAKEAIAFKEALETVGPTLEDGSYVLKSGSCALRIPLLDGFVEQEVSDGTVSMAGSDGFSLVTYALIPSMYEEQSMTAMIDTYTDLFSAMGVELTADPKSQTIPAPLGASDGYQLVSDGIGLYYTSVPVKGMNLYVLAVDLGGNWLDAKEALTPALAGVRELNYSDLQ